MKTELALALEEVEEKERCPTCSHPTMGPFVVWIDGHRVSAKMCITCLRIGADFVQRRDIDLRLDGSRKDGATFVEVTTIQPPQDYIPQDVAAALDCIDREEDEVGMHRELVDKWRRER